MKTFLKAKCRKTGKHFGLEVEKIGGVPVITNFVDLSESDYNRLTPQYSVDPHIETGRNLVPCRSCGSRKFGNCSCNKRKKSCSFKDKYDFQCVYCDELEIDYSGATEGDAGIYNKVNITNLPASAFDKHGNPQGDQFDLAKDGSMKGFRVVIIKCCSESWTLAFPERILRKKGFDVITYNYTDLPSEQTIRGLMSDKKTQIWVISDHTPRLNAGQINAIIDAYNEGRGLYVWGDNDPFYKDANVILNRTHGIQLFGNVYGGKVVSIQRGVNQPGIIPNHPIATGIINFYEGITIATVPCKNGLKPLVFGSECNIVTAYDDADRKRLLVDGGFTRLFHKVEETAGTERFVVNCAVWLANIERVGIRSLPKF